MLLLYNYNVSEMYLEIIWQFTMEMINHFYFVPQVDFSVEFSWLFGYNDRKNRR